MDSDLPVRRQYVIANAASAPESLYLSRSSRAGAVPEWVRGGRLKDVLVFDSRIEAALFCRGVPRGRDVEPEVVCAWMPSIDEILDSLGVPAGKRGDAATLKVAIGDLWVRAVLDGERQTRQSPEGMPVAGQRRIVHILKAGRPLCQQPHLAGTPGTWPAPDYWAREEDSAHANCEKCRRAHKNPER
jgi:hypothetical protein